jgi:sulfite reductase beta subunit-like hemoprotein
VEQLGRIADEFGGGRGHLTTRQNIQYHFVPLARVPDLMHLLADVGLTNREACYNTVRNVTACPWAGIAHDEVFDVRPYAQRVAYAFLRKDLTSNLPRKFKIAFDGCAGHDCIQGAINDIGLRAVIRDGRRGFRMIVGGGMGPLPMEAKLLDEFVPEERLLNRCEAVIRVFNQHGNRRNKNLARMKFLIRERGFDWLREQIEKEFADILANGGIAWPEIVPEGFGGYQSQPHPLGDGALLPVVHGPQDGAGWRRSNVRAQKQTGYAAVTVKVEQGNLTGDQLRAWRIWPPPPATGWCASPSSRTWCWLHPAGPAGRVHAALAQAGLGESGAMEIQDVITCPGATPATWGSPRP